MISKLKEAEKRLLPVEKAMVERKGEDVGRERIRVRHLEDSLFNEINGKKLTNFEFTYQLARELLLPFVQQRYESPVELRTQVLNKMGAVLHPNGDAPYMLLPQTTTSRNNKEL